jgi:MGT family glycosyltransferase
MKRFLFVVPPLAGHVNPTVSVARALEERGHRVAWVAHPRRVRPLLPETAELIALDDGISDDVWRPVVERVSRVRGLESFQVLWQDVLVPLARGMLPGVVDAIASYAPDVVVVDHQAIGGAIAARLRGIPWATLCTTSASVVDPLADLPKVKEWVLAKLESLQIDAGLPVVRNADISPTRVIVFSTKAFAASEISFPSHYSFVGPSVSDRPDATPFPFEALSTSANPKIFVSLGTVSPAVGGPFYAAVVEALKDQLIQVVLVAPEDAVPNPPENFIVRPRVPQLALLPHMNAVVCHGGHNTVCEALALGIPLVVAPIRDDQPVVAGQVVRAGAGVRLKFGRLTPAALRAAVAHALADDGLRQGAKRIQQSFASAGGAREAARLLEEMS